MKYKRVAMDTSKHVFTVHCVNAGEGCELRRDLRRVEVEAFFRKLEPTEVVLEACGGSHHWGRVLAGLGHRVRLIPPQYVKPFVRRGKSDRLDAEAINAAASRPDMRFVPVKTAEAQAELLLLRVREGLVAERTAQVNRLRGLAAEFGLVAAKGRGRLDDLVAAVAGSAMPQAGKDALAILAQRIGELDEAVAELDRQLRDRHAANPVSRRLAAVAGVGPLTALSLALTVEPGQFACGRDFAASLGLTPRQHSTAGRPRLGGISRAGNERLRSLLVIGATAVIRCAKPGRKGVSAWLLGLLERKPRKLVAVALANKMARILWAMLARGEAYRPAASG